MRPTYAEGSMRAALGVLSSDQRELLPAASARIVRAGGAVRAAGFPGGLRLRIRGGTGSIHVACHVYRYVRWVESLFTLRPTIRPYLSRIRRTRQLTTRELFLVVSIITHNAPFESIKYHPCWWYLYIIINMLKSQLISLSFLLYYTYGYPNTPRRHSHKMTADLKKALLAHKPALAAWQDITPLAEGKRRPCCWPGCMHRERKVRRN